MRCSFIVTSHGFSERRILSIFSANSTWSRRIALHQASVVGVDAHKCRRHGGWRHGISLEMELQVTVSSLMQALEMELGSFVRVVCVLNRQAIPPVPKIKFLDLIVGMWFAEELPIGIHGQE